MTDAPVGGGPSGSAKKAVSKTTKTGPDAGADGKKRFEVKKVSTYLTCAWVNASDSCSGTL